MKNRPKKLVHVVGARPNFMKIAPIMREMARYPEEFQQILVHTGQHYDQNMSKIFFEDLELPEPDIYLGVGSGSHAQQTARIMLAFEPVLIEHKPDWVIAVGDVNSTVACALTAAKLGIKVAHVEAGLRSFDRTMPEEINRLLTDQIADVLFTPSEDGDQNLLRQGVAKEKIHLVGNVMIDTVVHLLPKAQAASFIAKGLTNGNYALVTLHRPSNVDDAGMLRSILDTLSSISNDLPVIFPMHPRTRQRISDFGLTVSSNGNLHVIDPLGYLEFLALENNAHVVITDSGGIQEETTYLRVPCLTVRENTERPVTVETGTNIIVGHNMARLHDEVSAILDGNAKQGKIPPLWDGKASERIANIISKGMDSEEKRK
jgi:UDP-N-acetylglucosamine 2-epimerase (non-hydrolysing)